MLRSNLRERILGILASSVVVGGTACGGGVARQDDAGAGGPGAHAGSFGSDGGSSGSSSTTGGTPVTSLAGSGVGGSGVGGSGVGGSSVGGSSVGGSSVGGSSIGGSAPNGALNCANSGVGVCCDYDECYAPDAALAHFASLNGARITSTGAAGEGGAADSESGACPNIAANWLCGYVKGTSAPVESNGLCCYVVNQGSCCGRPFVVAGQARLPEVVQGTAWRAQEFPLDLAAMDPTLREALAAGWLEDARMEHASVAAFARFVLQLLAVGAPTRLVEAAQAAIADELRHAEVCFQLASRYAGKPFAAGALDVSGSLAALDLPTVAALAVTEGCIGETVAAALAAEAARATEHAGLKRLLEGIAEDETRHAELAWQFVQWALHTGGAPVYEKVAAAFAAALTQPTACAAGTSIDPLSAHGRFGASGRAARASRALAESVAPCARVLLQRTPALPSA